MSTVVTCSHGLIPGACIACLHPLDTTCRHRMVRGSCIDCGWTRPADSGPLLVITKVDRDWYTYEVRGNGVHVMGHGSRRYVYDKVTDALAKAQRSGA